MRSIASAAILIDPALFDSCSHAKIAVQSVIEVEDESINLPHTCCTPDPARPATIDPHPLDDSLLVDQGETSLRGVRPGAGTVACAAAAIRLTDGTRAPASGRRS